jgi:hypothetical protein
LLDASEELRRQVDGLEPGPSTAAEQLDAVTEEIQEIILTQEELTENGQKQAKPEGTGAKKRQRQSDGSGGDDLTVKRQKGKVLICDSVFQRP